MPTKKDYRNVTYSLLSHEKNEICVEVQNGQVTKITNSKPLTEDDNRNLCNILQAVIRQGQPHVDLEYSLVTL